MKEGTFLIGIESILNRQEMHNIYEKVPWGSAIAHNEDCLNNYRREINELIY